jgi:hypothetical protein
VEYYSFILGVRVLVVELEHHPFKIRLKAREKIIANQYLLRFPLNSMIFEVVVVL